MTKNKLARYIANTAVVAVMAAAGIGVYQLGTTPSEKQEIREEAEEEKLPEVSEEKEEEQEDNNQEDSPVDTGTAMVEMEVDTEEKENPSDSAAQKSMDTQETAKVTENSETTGTHAVTEQTDAATEAENVSASASAVTKLNFSEDTLMEWPVHGSILRDYNMDQTVYYATLDQYKLSPSIVVGAEEGAPVTCSVKGKVYSVEEDPQTGTTLTMELGDGYQAVYGQLKDLTVKEGDIVEKGTVIGYINAPTRYYSSEGSNLYFAMEKSGEPVDPIAYLP